MPTRIRLAMVDERTVAVLVEVSPLSLKFILASALRSEIPDRTFAD